MQKQEREPSRRNDTQQVLTCHHQLHGEVLVEAVFGVAQDHGVVPSMFGSHISYSQPVFQWVWLVAGVVVLDQFAILVPVWEVPLRFVMSLPPTLGGIKGHPIKGNAGLEALHGLDIYSCYPSTPEPVHIPSAVGWIHSTQEKGGFILSE